MTAYDCQNCGNSKDQFEFDKTQRARAKKGNVAWCKRCLKGKHTLKKYGLTIDEYEEKMQEQQSKCSICQTILKGDKNTHLDHNHETHAIRDFLCAGCNKGIGMFDESPTKLAQAIIYLMQREDFSKNERHELDTLANDISVLTLDENDDQGQSVKSPGKKVQRH